MAENTMKMKEIKDILRSEGYEISERMIKYYIEIGILPVPDYPHPNQAKYRNVHLIRLKRIGRLKEAGCTFSEIKKIFLDERNKTEKEAKIRNIAYDDMRLITAADLKEEADYIYESMQNDDSEFSKQDLLAYLHCDKIVFDLAVDTGAIEEKDMYDHYDLYVLLCVKNLMQKDISSNSSGNIIEKISDISKINNIASQLVHFYEKEPDRDWIYSYLLQSIIERKQALD